MMDRKGLSEEQAKKLIRQVDKDRSSYYKYYTDQIWGEIENYDLCINSARVGVDAAVKAIAGVVRGLNGE
jgi:cytidylate kinase